MALLLFLKVEKIKKNNYIIIIKSIYYLLKIIKNLFY